jgi:arylformamidase
VTGGGWRSLDAAAREREMSPSSRIGGHYEPFIAAYGERSHEARLATPGRLNLRYGEGEAHRVDVFVPSATAPTSPRPPLLVFIHGGYWQELSRQESSFAATDAIGQGVALAVIDYTLAPAASVATIVGECRQALGWLVEHADELGFDPNRIVLAGSSAGAHLAAMVALASQGQSGGRGGGRIRGTVLVSGIFELEPLVGTTINRALGLTPASARELSPALKALDDFPPSVVCWGEIETDEFKRQSRDFTARLGEAGVPCRSFELPGRNHFDVILDLAAAGTPLGDATLALLRATGRESRGR